MGQLEESDWPGVWTAQIGARIRTARQAAGLSAQKVSERCDALGFPIPRSTIANIESGRKEALPIHEISVLAAALELSPAALLFPVDSPDPVQVLPGKWQDPFLGWLWFSEAELAIASMSDLEWNAPAYKMDFVEALQHNITLARLTVAWVGLGAFRKRMEALGAVASVISDYSQKQVQIAETAVSPYEYLTSKGLPIPPLPPEMAEAIRAAAAKVKAGNKDV